MALFFPLTTASVGESELIIFKKHIRIDLFFPLATSSVGMC